MAKVLIIYATDYGNTQKMALAVAEGAKTVSQTEVTVRDAESATKEETVAADALIMGSPVHMGSPDWRIKKFIDKICSPLWMKDALIGKIGGVFVTGSGYGGGGGGNELCMLAMLNNFAELGMLIVPLPKNTPGYHMGGLQWGPYGRSAGIKMEQIGVAPEGLEAAYHHGANIARIADAFKGKDLFAKPQETSHAK